ncbi:MAG: signal peptidase II [Clostridia bacterium]|nr:signal peptidase II [Clostridia bacterium]
MLQLVSILCIAVLVAADQLIKMVVEDRLMPVGSIDFIPGIIEWNYTENTGAAFSIMENHTEILSVFTLVIIVLGLIYLLSGRIKNKVLVAAAILVLSGGLGNLIDRIFRGSELFHGYVVDYIKLLFVDFAIFNFADCLVCVGAGIIIIYMLVDTFRSSSDKKKGQKNG